MGNFKEYVVVASGTWGAAEQGHVTTYALDRTTGALSQLDRKPVGGLASYLARHPTKPTFYVADEDLGGVHQVELDPATGQLTVGTHVGQESGSPVYLSVDAAGSVLVGASYGAGTTAVFPLSESGAVQTPPTTYSTGAKSHASPFRPGTGHVYVPSLENNQISQFRLEGTSLVSLTPATVAQSGGPRHITFHPNGSYAYVVSELSDDVAAYTVGSEGTLAHLETVRRLPAAQASGAATHTGADVHVTPSGKHAYVSNRGESNTLAIYAIGEDGKLTLTGHEPTRGNTPRNFTIDPDGELLLVGNQTSQNVAVFRVNAQSGALTHLETAEVGVSPFFVGVWRYEP
jgi:6-phosphogluconolactonase